MSEEGTEGRQVDQRLIILGVFALVAVAIVAAILIGAQRRRFRLDQRRRLQGSRTAGTEERQLQGAETDRQKRRSS